uniref:Fatty acid desaturase domain-containing protein n=1 Tax=Arcella intermedia TaxID=1963864 RepID=A0A6B2L8W4_9EUKA
MGAVLFGIGYQQMGWLGHDACHHGLTSNRKFNNFLGYVFGNLVSGFSVNWWKDRHNTHHAITNVLESDPDVDNLPLFVWSELEVPKWKLWPGMARTIIPYQHLYFVPWTVTLKLIWCLQSAFFVRNLELQNKSYMKSLPAERLLLVLHYILLFFVLRLTPSFGAAVLFYLISEFIGGAGIALIVFMNHYSLEQIEKDKALTTDFLGLQLLGTKNINPGIFMDWFAGGLNYQVEHHLFPTIPRHNLSKVKPLVEKFCKDNDLPYQSETYYGCISAVLSKLRAVAGVYNKATEKRQQK